MFKLTPNLILSNFVRTPPRAFSEATPLVDINDNIYFLNSRQIVQFKTNGIISNTWDFGGSANPRKILIGANGNIFSLNYNSTISKISANQKVIQNWILFSPYFEPFSSAVDKNENLYLLTFDSAICKISSDGVVQKKWAVLNTRGVGNNSGYTSNIVVDKNNNLFYTSGDSSITQINSIGVVKNNFIKLHSKINFLTIDNNNNLFTLNQDSTISKISSNFSVNEIWYKNNNRNYLFVSDTLGNIFIANRMDSSVKKINKFGLVSKVYKLNTNLLQTETLIAKKNGELFLSDYNNKIIKIDTFGIINYSWVDLNSSIQGSISPNNIYLDSNEYS